MNQEPVQKYTEWPVIPTKEFATGLVSVPIKVEDYDERIYDCQFLAGFFAFASEGEDKRLKATNHWAIGTIVEPAN